MKKEADSSNYRSIMPLRVVERLREQLRIVGCFKLLQMKTEINRTKN